MTLAEKAELGWLCIVLSFLIMGLIFLIVRLITYPGLIAISWPFVLIWLLTIVIAYRLNGRRRGEEQERLQQPESDQPSNLEREWISVLERERLWHGAHEANPGAPQSSIMRGHTV
jgi:hypothetical protein